MRQAVTAFIRKRSFVLSLMAHLLLLLSFVISIHFSLQQERDKPPQLYVPSYTYQGDLPQNRPVPHQQVEKKPQKKTDKNGLEKPVKKQTEAKKAPEPRAQPAGGRKTNPELDQSTKSRVSEAVNLVGEKTVVKPLVEILGKALGARLKYPRMAMEFNLMGTSYVGFVLHPNGLVAEVRIVKSSGAGVLDDAALSGVREMSPVLNVAPYVDQPRFLVIGVIFGGPEKNRT